MTTPKHNNSTRLSLDIADLPLTPFGMSPHGSSRRRRIFASQKSNKLSLKTLKSPSDKQYTSSQAEKENRLSGVLSLGGSNHKSKSTNRTNPFNLETVDEISLPGPMDSESDDDLFLRKEPENEVDIQVLHTGNRIQGRDNLKESGNSNVTVRRRNRRDQSKDSSNRRDSMLTDIDDGDFIEYFHGKENGYVAPKVEKLPQLYYTCQSQNETQFSTSTKVATAPVGFRKFVEKVKTERPLHNIVEEEVEPPSHKKNNFLWDESIITGSADIMSSTEKKHKNKALNSTTVGWPAHHVRESLMPGLSDVSSLTLKTDKLSGSDSNKSTPYSYPRVMQKQKTWGDVQTIVLGSDDDESQVEQSISNHRISRVKKINSPTPPIPKENEVVSTQEEYYSIISEDVSIISSALPVKTYYQQPVKTVEATPKVLAFNYSEPSGEKDTYSTTSDSTVDSDDDSVPLNSRARVPVLPQRQYRGSEYELQKIEKAKCPTPDDPKKIIPDTARPTVAGWIISSPFKDSSFGTSFLNHKNDSDVSLSVSQKVEDKVSSESILSCEVSRRLRHLPEIGSPRAVARISGASKTESSSSSGINRTKSSLSSKTESDSQHSESEESELLIRRKSKATSKVICSDSDDSCDEIDSSRRKGVEISVTKNVGKHDKSKDQSVGESLHLRLSEEFSRTNKTSEKSVYTVGKDATSPKTFRSPLVHSDSNDSIDIHITRNRNQKNVIVESEDSNSDDIFEGNEEESESFMSLPDIEDNKTTINETSEDLFQQSIDKSSVPKNKVSQNKPVPMADTSLDFRVMQKELDKLYSSEWRKNESAVFKNVKKPIQEKEEDILEVNNTSDEDETPIKRKPKKIVNRFLTSDESSKEEEEEEEDSFLYQVEESCGEEEEEEHQNEDEDEDYEEREVRKTGKAVKQRYDESYLPDSPDRGDSSGNDDSFEAYLSSVKKQIAKDKKIIPSQKEDLDTYEDSFINDDPESEDDVSFYLPSLAERTKKNLDLVYKDAKSRGSVSEELISKGKTAKTKGSLSDPKGSIRSTKKSVTLKTSTSSSWRDSPTITLSSDSESDEVFPVSEVKKRPPPMFPLMTPKNKGVGKVFPKTEGHNKYVSKYRDTNRGDTTPTLSFLASLSKNVNQERSHPEALVYTKNFKKSKEKLADRLYTYYNTHAFENKLPPNMNIKWNARMTKTAGFCYYQIDRSKPGGRGARVELSTKVIDAPERLRDTLIHELCHAAAWIISGYKDGHGPLWKAWAAKASMAFPELPPISRCHSYEIACKYTYRCTKCSYSIGRHSKSLDTDRKVCGYCHGKFELIVNSQAGRGKGSAGSISANTPSQAPPKTPRTPGAFALFVKENYGTVKKSKENLKHADVMKILSSEFGKLKASSK